MKKIIAFGASNSSTSINKQLVTYVSACIKNVEVEILDLNDYEMPIFSVDREKETGIPQFAHDFKAKLKACDGIVISFAEHNGAYSTAFKNIFDWISRIESNVWYNKPMLLTATSDGARGAATVLSIAVNKFAFMTTASIISFSLPSFYVNFKDGAVIEGQLKEDLTVKIKEYQEILDLAGA